MIITKSGIVIHGAQSSQNIYLTKFDAQLALNQVQGKLGLRVSDAGDLSLFKYVEEAEFGPGFPVNTVFVMGKLFDANQTSKRFRSRYVDDCFGFPGFSNISNALEDQFKASGEAPPASSIDTITSGT
ncbi:hypothetical protein F3Y22_tig00112344pilonHSYRG00268 [Hibiscus syriacus]|uniref:Uncharacterized protein n=1 Tax=Hibiscus syriacus TaxID=106335 RepID=A0A6A2X0R5_HIBSY|nr:hypothetical protein F3Y22_tig00112344pilonHSYRG00268 [Hibiscus syriacus]